MLVHQVGEATRDLLVEMAKMVLTEIPELPALQVTVANLVKMVYPVFLDQWVKRVHRVVLDHQGYQVTRDLQENKEILVYQDLKDLEVGQVQRDQLGLWERLDQEAQGVK